eukprot:2814266-Lingulodinium_polyedra.AAC.1
MYNLVLAILLLEALGLPFVWKKFRGGFEVSWIGLWADLRAWRVGLSEARAEWLREWLREIAASRFVLARRVAEGLGRLAFGIAAVDAYKPFLGPWYAWCAAVPRGSFLERPHALRIIAEFLRERIAHDMLRCP